MLPEDPDEVEEQEAKRRAREERQIDDYEYERGRP